MVCFFQIGTNKLYNNEYQIALKPAIGIYEMATTLTSDIGNNISMGTSEMIYPLIYIYLAFVSESMQVRQFLYMIMFLTLGDDSIQLRYLMMD